MAETAFGGGGEDGQDHSVAFQATMTKGVGTPLWMAPELLVGGTKYGPEVDLYSFAIILWELATRKVPWEEEIAETEYLGRRPGRSARGRRGGAAPRGPRGVNLQGRIATVA